MDRFEPKGSLPEVAALSQNARSTLKSIITLVDGIRTSKWQHDHDRQPMVLPRTLKYRLWLLPLPDKNATISQMEPFAKQFKSFVVEICAPGNLYHEDLPEIRNAIFRVPLECRVQVACLIGIQNDPISLSDCLCIMLAGKLLKTAETVDEVTVKVARNMVTNWRLSENEGIRSRGVELSRVESFGNRQLALMMLDQ